MAKSGKPVSASRRGATAPPARRAALKEQASTITNVAAVAANDPSTRAMQFGGAGGLVPAEILEIFGPPPLLATESAGQFDRLLSLLALEFEPRSAMEWLLLKDLADINWEILRMRRIRAAVVKLNLPSAYSVLFGTNGDDFLRSPHDTNVQNAVSQLAVKARQHDSKGLRGGEQLDIALRKIGLTRQDLEDAAALDNFSLIERIEAAIGKLERRRERILQELRIHRWFDISLSKIRFDAIVEQVENDGQSPS